MDNQIDYTQIDPNLRNLVEKLNTFCAVHTIGSCGGHDHPIGEQWPADSWYVKFEISKDPQGWVTLEFLAWAINHDYRYATEIILLPDSVPPYLNEPGKCLAFVLEGRQVDPNQVAEYLENIKGLFVSPEEWKLAGELINEKDVEDFLSSSEVKNKIR